MQDAAPQTSVATVRITLGKCAIANSTAANAMAASMLNKRRSRGMK